MYDKKKKSYPTWIGTVSHRKDGGVYIRIGKDIELKKGERLSVVDPRANLDDDQKEKLKAEGVLKIPQGQWERIIYNSTFRDIYRLPPLEDSPDSD